MIKKATKKPVTIEYMEFTHENKDIVFNFITCNAYPEWSEDGKETIKIQTSEGDMIASMGDFIIKEPFDKERGFYPCKPDIFHLTYDLVE